MCYYRERNGDKAYLHFKNLEGEEDVRTNGFTIISGTGRWKFLIGQECIGATARISDLLKILVLFSLSKDKYVFNFTRPTSDKSYLSSLKNIF